MKKKKDNTSPREEENDRKSDLRIQDLFSNLDYYRMQGYLKAIMFRIFFQTIITCRSIYNETVYLFSAEELEQFRNIIHSELINPKVYSLNFFGLHNLNGKPRVIRINKKYENYASYEGKIWAIIHLEGEHLSNTYFIERENLKKFLNDLLSQVKFKNMDNETRKWMDHLINRITEKSIGMLERVGSIKRDISQFRLYLLDNGDYERISFLENKALIKEKIESDLDQIDFLRILENFAEEIRGEVDLKFKIAYILKVKTIIRILEKAGSSEDKKFETLSHLSFYDLVMFMRNNNEILKFLNADISSEIIADFFKTLLHEIYSNSTMDSSMNPDKRILDLTYISNFTTIKEIMSIFYEVVSNLMNLSLANNRQERKNDPYDVLYNKITRIHEIIESFQEIIDLNITDAKDGKNITYRYRKKMGLDIHDYYANYEDLLIFLEDEDPDELLYKDLNQE